ncbi:hypothetical protein H8E07_13420 [bacterium]|nr:hypothetical protein [bacterium]
MFTVQRTLNAHVNPADADFETVGEYITALGALRKMRRLDQQRRAGGSGTWAFNVRCADKLGNEWRIDDLAHMAS